MKTFINYILYGFYQIDYVFGDRRCLYNIGTGGVLFTMSVFLYTYSVVLLVIGGVKQCGFIKFLSTNLLIILFIFTYVIVIWGFDYWLKREKYKSTFEKLDKEPSIIRWECFILAILWVVWGILCLCGSFNYVHKLIIIE